MAGHHRHVSLVAIPDAVISTLAGLYDVLNGFGAVAEIDPATPPSPFTVEIVGETAGPVPLASGLPVEAHRAACKVETTDIIIVPSVLLSGDGWRPGRYPGLVDWLTSMHARGATLCSACSGIFLLAETGLFDGVVSTVHWGYAKRFRHTFPAVPISPERVLVAAGRNGTLITSGASTSWHDLALYLIARHVGPVAAQSVARFFALQWHHDGLAPFIFFAPPRDHGDAAILRAQDWLATHYAASRPVEEMAKRSGLAVRTLKRRFTKATGLTPIAYVQALRVEEAKRRLERTTLSVEEIGWKVGYEDPAFFRRLFKRLTGITPGAYRRRFSVPAFDDTGKGEPTG